MSRRDFTKLITRLHRARRELKRLEARGDTQSMKALDLMWFVSDAEDILESSQVLAY